MDLWVRLFFNQLERASTNALDTRHTKHGPSCSFLHSRFILAVTFFHLIRLRVFICNKYRLEQGRLTYGNHTGRWGDEKTRTENVGITHEEARKVLYQMENGPKRCRRLFLIQQFVTVFFSLQYNHFIITNTFIRYQLKLLSTGCQEQQETRREVREQGHHALRGRMFGGDWSASS